MHSSSIRSSLILPSFIATSALVASLASAGCTPSDDTSSDGEGGGQTSGSEQGGSSSAGGAPGTGGNGNATGGSGGGEAPVDLTMVDCKTSTEDPKCPAKLLVDTPPVGSGPRVATSHGAPDYLGGFVEGTALVVATEMGVSNTDDLSVIARVELTTGERKFLSGKYEDPSEGTVTIGAGPDLAYPIDVQKGADGSLVAIVQRSDQTLSVLRIDAASGDRTELWKSLPSRKVDCEGMASQPILSSYSGLALGSAGELYLATYSYGPTGAGVVRIAADGACQVVTLSGATDTAENVGTGPELKGGVMRRLTLDGSQLYLLHDQSSLFSIDLADGKRKRVSSSNSGTKVGAGDADLGVLSLSLAPDAVWTTGGFGGGAFLLTAVDPTSGNRQTGTVGETFGPVRQTLENTPGVWYIPGSPYLVVDLGEGVILYDSAAGNSNLVSY